jgi:hypothetical protein
MHRGSDRNLPDGTCAQNVQYEKYLSAIAALLARSEPLRMSQNRSARTLLFCLWRAAIEILENHAGRRASFGLFALRYFVDSAPPTNKTTLLNH